MAPPRKALANLERRQKYRRFNNSCNTGSKDNSPTLPIINSAVGQFDNVTNFNNNCDVFEASEYRSTDSKIAAHSSFSCTEIDRDESEITSSGEPSCDDICFDSQCSEPSSDSEQLLNSSKSDNAINSCKNNLCANDCSAKLQKGLQLWMESEKDITTESVSRLLRTLKLDFPDIPVCAKTLKRNSKIETVGTV